jgi:hypothetical protein
VPLATQAEWAWHTQPNPENYRYEDRFEEYKTFNGRTVRYPSEYQSPGGQWYRENPYKRGLTTIAFRSLRQPLQQSDITGIRQELDLWNGAVTSEFQWQNRHVQTRLACHPERDAFAFEIKSSALTSGDLAVSISFPYTTPGYPWPIWGFGKADRPTVKPNNETWAVAIVSQGSDRILLRSNADADHYYAAIHFRTKAELKQADAETFLLRAGEPELRFTIEFTPEISSAKALSTDELFAGARRYWNRYWQTGACLDLAGSTDARAGELERRAVLSSYLTAIQCSGRLPPQESGLSGNSWYGKFHGEMHWWHAAHFPLWGRPELLERSMAWYQRIMPRAQAYAAYQGYQGARWPKECGPEARVNPHTIGPFLIWQQPHLIYFAELLYRAHPSRETIARYSSIVDQSAVFMASFAEWDAAKHRYVLGPPVMPAQERYPVRQTFNPTYELAYWAWGLKTVQVWRQRQGLKRQEEWDNIIQHLSALPVKDGVYVGAESQPDLWAINRSDHPSFLAALGVLPGDMVDREVMRRTLEKTIELWPREQTWSWDYPMMAMTATRLGLPEVAIDALLMESPHNKFSPNGHCFQAPRLAAYLPGNGGLLSALALMAAGWDGSHRTTPGFPNNGKWQVKASGFSQML